MQRQKKDRERLKVYAASIVAALFLFGGMLIGKPVQAIAQDSGPVNAGAPEQVIMTNVPAGTQEALSSAPKIIRPQNGLTDADWDSRASWMGKRNGRVLQSASLASAAGAEPAGAGNVVRTPGAGVNFQGLNETNSGGWQPSDMGLAVGTTYVLQAVNSEITIMNKAGVTQAGFPKTLNAFLGTPGAFTFDPRALYDWNSNRWIVVVDEADFANSRGFINIAVSQTSDPTLGWYLWRVQMGGKGQCPDYPTLGQDKTGVYIAANKFTCNTSGFLNTYLSPEVWLLPKSALYAGGGLTAGLTFWAQSDGFTDPASGLAYDTIQPVNVMNRADDPRAEFMVNSYNINFGGGQCWQGCSGLVVWAVSNPFGFLTGGPAPRFSQTTVPTGTYYLSPGANTPSCNFCVDAGDTRITGSVNYSSGSIFTSVTTGVPGTSPEQTSPFWWELGVTLNDNDGVCAGGYLNRCPLITGAFVRQEDCYLCGGWANSGSAFYATLQPDPENDVTMVFNFSSKTIRPGTAYVSRRVTYGQNLMHDSGNMLQSGLAAYHHTRWGDYTATALDLTTANNPLMWFSGMYSRADGHWGTKIGRNGYTNVNQP
ncbi:MAG: hypothetical protein PH343_06475 [Nitrospira sp.]|nr:hypothetical protein [Nitrospira sp.]